MSAADRLSVGITPIGGSVDIFSNILGDERTNITYKPNPGVRLPTYEAFLELEKLINEQQKTIDALVEQVRHNKEYIQYLQDGSFELLKQDVWLIKRELKQGPREARMNNKLPGPSAC